MTFILLRRRFLTLDHCEVVLVHLTPVGEQSAITHKAKMEVIILLCKSFTYNDIPVGLTKDILSFVIFTLKWQELTKGGFFFRSHH